MRSRLALAPLIAALACASGEPFNSSNSGISVSGGVSPTAVEDMTTTGDAPTSEAVTTTAQPDLGTGEGDASTSTGDALTGPLTTDPSTTGPDLTSTGAVACDGPCDDPPSSCYLSPGGCVDGTCTYEPAGSGFACDDGDPCTTDDVCDDVSSCAGTPIDCARPNATGGACVDGACQGFACVAPWDNCDGDWANGCEVPVGVANQCDAAGLNPDTGCWTAYCGALDDPDATNFGTYFCFDCSTCHEPAAGQWQWCNHTTGTWYAPEPGACGASKDLVCAP